MGKRPCFVIGLASFLAVLFCTATTPTVGLLTVIVLSCVLFPLSFIKKLSLMPRVMAAASAAALLVAFGTWWLDVTQVRPQLAMDGTVGRATMRVERSLPTENAYIVRVESGEISKGIRLCFWPGFRQMAPQNGDLIVADVELLAAYDTQKENGNSAKANGVYLYAWPQTDGQCYWLDGQESCPPVERALYALRGGIHTVLYRFTGFDEAALCEGVLIGERGNLSSEIGDNFRASGVYHLLAVSGSHMSILAMVMFRILNGMRCPRRPASVITACGVIVLTGVCGFTASVMRASAMMLFMLLGNLFRRRADGLNSLGLAALVLLLIDPYCAYDLGWQLSFAATFGLLVFTPIWSTAVTERAVNRCPALSPISRPLCEAVGVSLCASLTTAPLSMWYFGEFSPHFLAGNLLCVPLSSVLLIFGFLGVLTAWIPLVPQGIFLVCEWVSRFLIEYTAWLSALPFSVVFVEGIWMIVALTVSVAGVIVGYRFFRVRGVVAVIAVGAVLVTGGYAIDVAQQPKVSYIKEVGSDRIAVAVVADDTVGLIIEANGDTLENASRLLRDEGIRRVDWMLWLSMPSVQATNVQALRMPVGELLITADPSRFAVLPAADTVTSLPYNEPFSFGDGYSLIYDRQALRLTCDDVFVMIRKQGNARLLTLQENDVEETVLFCGHSDIESMAQIHTDVRFAVEEDWTYVLP